MRLVVVPMPKWIQRELVEDAVERLAEVMARKCLNVHLDDLQTLVAPKLHDSRIEIHADAGAAALANDLREIELSRTEVDIRPVRGVPSKNSSRRWKNCCRLHRGSRMFFCLAFAAIAISLASLSILAHSSRVTVASKIVASD
jgi:hypothetical protein